MLHAASESGALTTTKKLAEGFPTLMVKKKTFECCFVCYNVVSTHECAPAPLRGHPTGQQEVCGAQPYLLTIFQSSQLGPLLAACEGEVGLVVCSFRNIPRAWCDIGSTATWPPCDML